MTLQKIYCHSLLYLSKHDNFAALKVKPGMACFLVRDTFKANLYCFVSSEEWKELHSDNEFSNPNIFKVLLADIHDDCN